MRSLTLKASGLGILMIVCFFISSCKKADEPVEEKGARGIEVVAGNPVSRKMIEYITLNGNTIYQKQEIVRGTFPGFIDKSYKNVGDRVKQGDLLFMIKTKEADAAGNVSATSTDKPFNGLVKINARTDGVMIELDHQTGDYIADGEQLAIVVDPASLRIALEVPYANAKSVSASTAYVIQLPDGKDFGAHVSQTVPSMDPANQTMRYILVPNTVLNLPANLNVGVKIPSKVSESAVALPASAIMTNETQTEFWIMKIINDSTAIKLPVSRGIESDSMVQITEPALSLTDKFVLQGAFGLPDTASVAIQRQEK